MQLSVNLDIGTCDNGAWSNWKDRDDPNGNFDAETIENFATDYSDEFQGTDLCANPIAAQSRILGTTDMSTTEHVQFSSNGLRCKNSEQTDGKCSDYEVRFCCPQKSKLSNSGNFQETIIFLAGLYIYVSLTCEKYGILHYSSSNDELSSLKYLSRRMKRYRAMFYRFFLRDNVSPSVY